MAWSGSGLFVANFVDVFDATQLALNLVSTANKLALFQSAVTPDYNAAAASAAYAAGVWNANEASGTGYTAGGLAVVSPTFTGASGIATFDMNDNSWAASSITARGALLHADGLTPKAAICAVDFGDDYTTTNGTFLIQWHALGVFTFDLVP